MSLQDVTAILGRSRYYISYMIKSIKFKRIQKTDVTKLDWRNKDSGTTKTVAGFTGNIYNLG